MLGLSSEPIQLKLFNEDSEVLLLRINSELGTFTLTENEDLLAEEETSYFNLDREECIIDRCRLTQEEKQTLMYFLFVDKFIDLLTSGSNKCKTLTMEEIIFNDFITNDILVKFYARLTGENAGQIKYAISTSLDNAKNFEVTPSVGGLLTGIQETYLSTGHTLLTSPYGMAILKDKEFVSLRVFDTGDSRFVPTNFYSKLCKLSFSNPSSINPLKTRVLKVLKLYTLSTLVNNLTDDKECQHILIDELVNIYWRLKRG